MYMYIVYIYPYRSSLSYFQSFFAKIPNLPTAAAFCNVLVSVVMATGAHQLKSIISKGTL